MTKRTIKKSIPMVIGGLVIALLVSIIPGNLSAEASRAIKDPEAKKSIVDVVKVDRDVLSKLKTENYISLEKAEEIALGSVKGKTAKITEIEMKLITNQIYYKIVVQTKFKNKDKKDVTKSFNITINGFTGAIRDVETQVEIDKPKDDKVEEGEKDPKPDKDKKYITKEEAIKIALKQIGKDAKLDEIEFEIDDKIPMYEIERYDDEYEYEIVIHAITGEVLKYEKELD